jgi:hypothetical protein
MRIGTWNLAGRWGERHSKFLLDADCDVWLLTEVHERTALEGFEQHLSVGRMAADRRWAGVCSRFPLMPLPDPHAASAAARVDGMTYCSSILPWRTCGGPPTWPGERHAGKTAAAVNRLLSSLPNETLVWGGDWNHALSGPEFAGSKAGREHITTAVERLGLKVPTAMLPHRLEGLLSIDHLAMAADRTVVVAERRPAEGLSDHDGYVVELAD